MPELPEVESIASRLNRGTAGFPGLPGAVITGASLLWERTLAEPSPGEFLTRVTGQSIQVVGRRGKFLVFSLSQDALLIHLRMSGDIITERQEVEHPAYLRLLLNLDTGWRMAFTDARKFGRIWLVREPQDILGPLGPEPLEETLTTQLFFSMLHQRHRQLKPLLLDQHFLAGLGNIYTDEALHMSGLHPLMDAAQITADQAAKLLECIRSVLREGIRRNGASIDWVYRGGDFQNYFRVYQRTGQPCPACGTLIERLTVGQRGTHYCPQCQPLPP